LKFLKLVLDQIYEDVEGTDNEEKCDKINKECTNLYDFYKGPTLMLDNTPDINYSKPEIRFAYVYRNTGLHSIILSQILQKEAKSKQLGELWKKKNITVTALGGGPGSDALGIALFCQGLSSIVKVSIFDRVLWQDCWINVIDVDAGISSNTTMNFLQFDATKPERKMPQATDLVTMIYFVSEMYRYSDEFKQFLEHATKQFKPGTLFLVIEMAWWQFTQWIDKTFLELGLKCCLPWQEHSSEIDYSYLEHLNPYYQYMIALNHKNKPRSFANNVKYCLWEKPFNKEDVIKKGNYQ